MPELAKPVMGPITSRYGWRTINGVRNFHNGLDYGWLYADVSGSRKVYSAHPGIVDDAAYSAIAGNYVLVNIGGGYRVRYIHLASSSVTVGQRIGYSTLIGTMGDTGSSTSQIHLHMDLFSGDTRINPEPHVTLPFGYDGPDLSGGGSTTIPPTTTPIIPADEYYIEDDEMTIKVGARKEADGTAKEWIRIAPWITGGYQVTTDVATAIAWSRLHGRGFGVDGWDFFVERNDYIAIQTAARTAHAEWMKNK